MTHHFKFRLYSALKCLLIIGGHALRAEQASPGDFRAPNDPIIPAAVRLASKSVFQIFYPHGPVQIIDTTNLDLSTMSRADDQWFKIVEVKVCLDQHIVKCPVTGRTFSGTAYLLSDAQTLATNLHNVQSWYYHVLRNNPTLKPEDLQAPLIVTDVDGAVAFNPLNSSTTMKLTFFNRSPKTFAIEFPWSATEEAIFFRLSDYVEMRLNVAFSTSAPLRAASLKVSDEPLFLVGFPHLDGGGKWISIGKIGTNVIPTAVNYITDNAAEPGSSGSPLLTSEGHVVGILISGSHGKTQYLTTDRILLQSVWKQINSQPSR